MRKLKDTARFFAVLWNVLSILVISVFVLLLAVTAFGCFALASDYWVILIVVPLAIFYVVKTIELFVKWHRKRYENTNAIVKLAGTACIGLPLLFLLPSKNSVPIKYTPPPHG